MAETDNDGSWYRDKQWLIQLMMVADADMNYDWYKEEWWIIKWIEKADIEWSTVMVVIILKLILALVNKNHIVLE